LKEETMNMMKRTLFAAGKIALATASVAMLFAAAPTQAQAPGATIHGSVTDPAGSPVTKGEVRFTTDKTAPQKDMKFTNVTPLDATGNYKATGVKAGDYIVFVFQGDVAADYQQLTVKDGDDKTINFDMTREEYMKSLSPERRKEIEDFKKKNAEVSSANKVVANLNTTLNKVRADLTAAMKNKDDVSQDVTDMKAAVAAKPDEAILQLELGNAEQAQADHLAKADKAAGKAPQTDDDVKQLYSDAGDAYKKTIDLNAASKKPDPHTQASAANQMGNALAKEGKFDDSSAAFEKAATLDAASAGMYYNNEAAVLFNSGQIDPALAAANKAIAADPNRPDPYFIKGQALISKTTLDPKTNKLVAPAGCAEAYQKYLELAPDGAQAATVKDILTSLGEKVDTSYKAGKKK
jgi:tetratricopeptide (TPR) repeat protein